MKRPFANGLRNATLSLLVVTTLYGMGCTTEAGDSAGNSAEDRLSSVEQGVGGDPGTHNHFRPKCFWDHAFQQTARDLALDAITNEEGKLPDMPYIGMLLDPECRQEAVEILVGCALEPGEFVFDGEDESRVYEGELGFASNWVNGPLTKTEKERLTGCMLERLNAFGIEMSILVYSHPDFTPVQDALNMYPVTESQAWGNLFDSTVTLNPTNDPSEPTLPAFDAYVCQETGMYDCAVAGVMYTSGRICDNNHASCGLIMMGQCDNLCPHDTANECDIWSRRTYARTPDVVFCDSAPL